MAINPATLPIERGGVLGPLVVELGTGSEATVECRLRCDVPRALDGAQLALSGRDERGGYTFLGSEPIRQGLARFERVPVGSFFVRPVLHYGPRLTLADLPMTLETLSGLEVTTRADDVTVIEVTVGLGGRIELSLLARHPALPAPQAMLIERGGNEVLPALLAPDGAGHRIAPGLDGDGPFLLQRALPPGEYTLRVEGEGYRRAEQSVTVRKGETTRVTVALQLEP